MFGDDWGQQTGLLFGRRLWQRFIKPRITQLYGAVKRAGKAVLIHSCGQVQELFPELIEAGLDVFNPFQPEVMDPYEMKRQFGSRLAFLGGVSVQKLLPFGTPQQIRDEVRRLDGRRRRRRRFHHCAVARHAGRHPPGEPAGLYRGRPCRMSIYPTGM